MSRSGRKTVALFALVAAMVMLWLERHNIMARSGEAIFWLVVGVLAILLALMELSGVGARASDETKSKRPPS